MSRYAAAVVLGLVTLLAATASTSPSPSSSCQWQQPSEDDEPSLRCQLRTLQPAEWDAQLSRVSHPERATSLRIECSDVLFFESALERDILKRLPRLRQLSVSSCKVRAIQPGSLASLPELRRLSIRTHNTDWPAMALTLTDQSLAGLRELRHLDLSDNSLISTPEGLFCSLPSLSGLNLSSNRLQGVSSLGFDSSSDDDCLQELTELDLSWNGIGELHPLSFRVLRKLHSLSLQHNGLTHVADQSLSGLESLRMLNLSSNQLSVLPPDFFRDCRELREIDLHDNALSVLPLGSLAGLSQLQVLDLSRNSLNALHRDTFAGLLRLVVLNLGRNALTRIDATLFRDLASLQVLRLDSNLIESVDADAFLPLFNLHTLDLSNNRINTVSDRLLGGLFVLSSLSLGSNRIASISADAFRNCSGLRDLDLSGNSLTSIPEAVGQLSLLKSLDLSANRITRAANLSSSAWQQLYSLNLADNHIRTVSKEAFAGLGNLVALNLAGNQLEQLEAGTFDRTSGLQVLRLDGNALTDVNGLFAVLSNLRWLNVSANRIQLFDYSFLPSNVEWLDIHQNNLAELGNYFQIQLPNLQALDASYNQLTDLTPDSVPDSVVQFFVNDNRIASIAANTFLKKANLSRVDLNSNQLRTLDPAALWLSPVPVDRELPEFSLGDNPWECDCGLEWLPLLVQPSSTSRQQPRLIDAADVTCRLTFRRQEGGRINATAEPALVPLVDVRPEEFLCSYQTHCFALCHCCDFDACDCEMTCPTGCSCYHDPTWSSNIVDCSASSVSSVAPINDLPEGIPMDVTQLYLDGNNLTELPSHAFIGRKNLRTLYLNGSRISTLRNRTFHGLGALQVLHLADNHLEELRGSEFEPLDHLKELYLQNNKLRYVADTTFIHLRSLEVLRLDGNHLLSFPLWRLGVNPHLNRLSLGRNPWSCECRFLADFQLWIVAHPAQLADPESLHCITSDHQLIGFDEFNRSCSADPMINVVSRFSGGVFIDHLPVFLVCLCLAVLGLIIGIVLVVYRQAVRIWIFSRYHIRLCDSKSDDFDSSSVAQPGRKDFVFYAFVSYSLKDEQFVSQVLAAELEHCSPAFRLCLQHRDFPGNSNSGNGNPAAGDPLALGLAASRRIVLVVSQSFIESEWTRPEVRTALTGFLRRPRSRLIAVLLTSWTDDQSDAELSLLLRSSELIRWGERNFWPKIRYYLPDPNPRQHYIRNIHSGSGLWYQGSTATTASSSGTLNAKRTLPHPLPAEAELKPAKSELYWEVNGGAQNGGMLPRRYTATPQHGTYACRAHEGHDSVYSGQCYSRLEHSYMSIDHGHEHIYSCVQDPSEHRHHHHHHPIYHHQQQQQQQLQYPHHQQQQQQQQQHPDCWSYRYPAQQHAEVAPTHMTMHHVGPRPPVHQPDFIGHQQTLPAPQPRSTFLV